MVRRSLAETLNAQALQFLREGSGERSDGSEQLSVSRAPQPGFEKALALDIWSEEEQRKLREHLLACYREDLERTGARVTKEGLVESPRGHVPTTRGLDKELRTLRREVAVLSDINRNLLRLIVLLSGCDGRELLSSCWPPRATP